MGCPHTDDGKSRQNSQGNFHQAARIRKAFQCDEVDGKVNGREYHGLVYFATDDNGKVIANPLKVSRLGKFASRTAVEGRFERDKEKIDVAPTRNRVADVLARATDKDDFTAKLKECGIDVVFRYTDEVEFRRRMQRKSSHKRFRR